MGIRQEQRFTFTPGSLTDSVDGTQAPPGALTVCSDLVISPTDASLFVPRPAATKVIDLSSINPNGVVSCFLPLGNIVYGLISSTAFPGKDQPFAANVQTGTVYTVAGAAAANLPATIPQVGDWVPPTMVAIGGRILATHPGFAGGSSGAFFGSFDISSFTSTVYSGATTGNTTSGSNVVQSLRTPVGNSDPIDSGYYPGLAIAGAGIPAGTTIVSTTKGTFSLATTGSFTSGSNSVTSVANLSGVQVGMLASGPELPTTGLYVTAISGSTVTLSGNAIATAAGAVVTFTGGGTITMSNAATATANGVALTVSGGTPTAPLWTAGNTNTNALISVPTCVAGYNARAWFGMGAFAVYSDVENPTQVSFASQALAIGDPTSITAMQSVPLTSQLTGGIQQSLTIYKGGESFFQVTGDALTANLELNAVTGSVGTLAPATIAQTPKGVMMVAVDGTRLLGLTGLQGDIVGGYGQGVVAPFTTKALTSRINAAYAGTTYRVSVAATTASVPGFTVTASEYWFHIETGKWTGPHSFPSQLVESTADGTSFLVTSWIYPAAIFKSDPEPSGASTFVEARGKATSVQLGWQMTSAPLPDNQQLAYVQVVRASFSCVQVPGGPIMTSIYAQDPGNSSGSYVIPAASVSVVPKWGSMVWGSFVWGGGGNSYSFTAKPLYFSQPVVGRQLVLQAQCATSTYGQKAGNWTLGFQLTGYNSPQVS